VLECRDASFSLTAQSGKAAAGTVCAGESYNLQVSVTSKEVVHATCCLVSHARSLHVAVDNRAAQHMTSMAQQQQQQQQ
jgi:hypothetical protein